MKKLIVLGNWKANKTIDEATQWITSFSAQTTKIPEDTEIILCPAYHHLQLFLNTELPISLGVQDISAYDAGAYTGEMSASMLPSAVTYALLGHSERRKNFGETDDQIAQKVLQAVKHNIRPVVCVSEVIQAKKLKEFISDFSETGIILYEPLFAIGSGNADSPENANTIASQIQVVLPNVPIIYGGSIVPENVNSFTKQEFLHGVGVGGASLDPKKFAALITSVR